MAELALFTFAAYLIGSIPFGMILTRMAGLGDIRKIGSGNIGATNVLRTGNKRIAFLTLLLDFGKGFLPVYLLQQEITPVSELLPSEAMISIPAAIIIGHAFPVWLKFRGGKGVACIFGLTFALSWIAGLFIAAGWLMVFFSTRYSSLAAITGIPIGIGMAGGLLNMQIVEYMLFPLVLMLAKHGKNAQRLLNGEEHRFTFKTSDKAKGHSL